MDSNKRLKRLRFRAWHRGTREADLLVGGYFDRFHAGWDEADLLRFEALMDEQDADIVSWVLGTLPLPERIDAAMMAAMRESGGHTISA